MNEKPTTIVQPVAPDECLFCHGTRIQGYKTVIQHGQSYQIAIRCHCSPLVSADANDNRKRQTKKRIWPK